MAVLHRFARFAIALIFGAALGLSIAQQAMAADVARPDDLVFGRADAKCTIIEYAALHCPFCAKFHETIFPKLKADYIDTGKVRLIFRDFPIYQPDVWAAQIARGAGPMQRAQYIALFYKTQNEWFSQKTTLDDIAKIALRAGMSRARFDECIKDKAIEEQILQSAMDGMKLYKIEATPSFVIGGKTYPGIASYQELEALIRANS